MNKQTKVIAAVLILVIIALVFLLIQKKEMPLPTTVNTNIEETSTLPTNIPQQNNPPVVNTNTPKPSLFVTYTHPEDFYKVTIPTSWNYLLTTSHDGKENKRLLIIDPKPMDVDMSTNIMIDGPRSNIWTCNANTNSRTLNTNDAASGYIAGFNICTPKGNYHISASATTTTKDQVQQVLNSLIIN